MAQSLRNLTEKGFCAEYVINHKFSAPITPKQNGVVETKNRPLVEIVRTILINLQLAVNFWANAVNTPCYMTNRCLIRKRSRRHLIRY